MNTLTVRGYSDDLISIGGVVAEEFSAHHGEDGEGGDLLAFSDGTVLRVVYTDAGVWRITPVRTGTGELTIDQAPEGDEDRYYDTATLRLDLAVDVWVVHGTSIAPATAP